MKEVVGRSKACDVLFVRCRRFGPLTLMPCWHIECLTARHSVSQVGFPTLSWGMLVPSMMILQAFQDVRLGSTKPDQLFQLLFDVASQLLDLALTPVKAAERVIQPCVDVLCGIRACFFLSLSSVSRTRAISKHRYSCQESDCCREPAAKAVRLSEGYERPSRCDVRAHDFRLVARLLRFRLPLASY